MIAVLLHGFDGEGVVAVGGKGQVKVRGELGLGEDEVGIILGGDITHVAAQNLHHELAGRGEVGGGVGHGNGLVIRVGGVVVNHQEHVAIGSAGGYGQAGAGEGELVGSSSSGIRILGAKSAIAIQRIDIGDAVGAGALGSMLQGDGAAGILDFLEARHFDGHGGAGLLDRGAGLSGKQAKVKQGVTGGELGVLRTVKGHDGNTESVNGVGGVSTHAQLGILNLVDGPQSFAGGAVQHDTAENAIDSVMLLNGSLGRTSVFFVQSLINFALSY